MNLVLRMDTMTLTCIVAGFAAFATYVGGRKLPTEFSWIGHPTQSFMSWWKDYQALLQKARDLEGKDGKESRKKARRTGGWSVSPLQAFRNVQEGWADPSVKRLMRETTATTPWVLVAMILLVSLGGSYVVIRRAALMAEFFDVLTSVTIIPASLSILKQPVAHDETVINAAWQRCLSLLVAYVTLHLVEDAIDVFAGWLTDELRMRIELKARKSFFTAILSQDISYLDSQQMSDMQRHLHEAPFAIHEAAMVPARLIRYFCTFLAGLYSMFAVDWQMAIAAWVFRMPLTLNIASYAHGLLSLHWRLAEDMTSRSSALISEALANVRLIQIYAAEEYETSSYAALLAEGHRTTGVLRVVEKLVARVQNLLSLFWDAGSMGFAAWRIVNGKMTIGSFNAFKAYQSTTTGSFEALMHETSRLRMAARKCETYFDILDNTPSVLRVQSVEQAQLAALKAPDSANASVSCSTSSVDRILGEVEFRNVTFRYPKTKGNSEAQADALHNVSFHIPAGKTAAFVGRSGAGKSTLLRLLIRFYDALEGTVLIDGKDIKTLDARSLRRHIGFVEQEPTMLNRTIKENICFGFDPASVDYPSDEAVRHAAEQAHVHDVIMKFPDGYNTVVGDRGIRLSGGEKQRIAVARAFVRNPAILLLDEPTAALDAESESQVKAGIEELMKGRTVLIIAHRLRTVQSADIIHVFNAGEILESGSHDSLLRKNGHYAMLVSHQMIDTIMEPHITSPTHAPSCSPPPTTE